MGKGLGAPGLWGIGQKFLGGEAEETWFVLPSIAFYPKEVGWGTGPGCSWPQGRTAAVTTLLEAFQHFPTPEG